ncbi:nuclease-related domain-containing protein [Cyclobacterium sp. SYSU L10401]|uniref:nuclease-related domain-containing protein n=1 Tax=Cyclobacterium sp. SYSU L10401 TaxID=2678657 RepID=UPI00293BF8D4|nr:nuclease-related domain-containing protein [Cyclobacterium sp. SYSU L10401]
MVILRENHGALIIEVKDYHLDSYELDERRNWKVKGQSFNIKSPLNQVVQYKENLFDLHIEYLQDGVSPVAIFGAYSVIDYNIPTQSHLQSIDFGFNPLFLLSKSQNAGLSQNRPLE